MRLFGKKPSMNEKRLALGLIEGATVAVHRYVPLLRDALNGAAMYREPKEIADDMGIPYSATPQQEAAVLQILASEFSSLRLRIDKLTEVRPETAQLLDVHVAAANYLQQFQRTAELGNIGLAQEFSGNVSEARRLYAESDRVGDELQGMRKVLAAELRRLARADSTLYASLGIPQQTLIRLSLT